MSVIRLTTLGEIDLRRSDGDPVTSVLQQPRRFALLCYLAVADTALVNRDVLIGLFWPEKREENARHALSQAAHYLRRSLAPEVLQGGAADGYGIAPALLWCDAAQFLALLRRGEPAAALRLYRGDFLPGFFVSGAPDFERWLEGFRGHLRRRAAEAAWQVAESAAEADAVRAAQLGRQAVELSLGDEAAIRRLLELLERVGDRAGALEAFESLRGRLAAEYDSEPSAETVRMVARLRASPGARTPSSSAPESIPAERPAASPAPAHGHDRPGRTRRRLLRAAASAAVTAALIGSFVSLWGLAHRRADPPVAPSIVIEEVRDYSRTDARDDLAGAVTADLLARLARVAGLRVRPADGPATGTESRPHHLLLRTGMLRSADSVRVTAVLLDGHSRIPIDRAVTVRPTGEPITLVDDIASWLSGFARTGAGEWLRERAWRERHSRGHALDLMRRAVRDREAADSLRRAGLFTAALTSFRKADSLLAVAENAAPDWNEPAIQRAETSLGLMWLHLLSAPSDPARSRNSLEAGLRHAARAVRSGDPAALELRAVLRHWLWRLAPPDSYPAAAALLPAIEADLARAVQLDPTRARAWETLSALLQARGKFGDARWAAQQAYEADAYLGHSPGNMASLYSIALETNDFRSARYWCDRLKQHYAGENVCAYCELMLLATFGSSGSADVERGWAAIRELGPRAESPPWRSRYDLLMGVLLARADAADSAQAMLRRGSRDAADPETAPLLAWGLLELGQADSAATVLERYVSPRLHARIGVLRSDRFRELRQHPRLAALLQS